MRLLSPDPGQWSLDWSQVDRGAPFGWPEQRDPVYAELATFLARLNEIDIAEVFAMVRANFNNANHAIAYEGLSAVARGRWDHLFAERGLDLKFGDLEVVALTYCLAHGDARRVFVAYEGEQRRMFPLWWDPLHEVTGADDKQRAVGACTDDCLHD